MNGIRSLLRRDRGEPPATEEPPASALAAAGDGEGAPFADGPSRPISVHAFDANGVRAIVVRTNGERLVDVFNAADPPRITDDGGAPVELDELLIVVAQERISDPARRLHRPGHAMKIRIGPWLVDGSAHAPPAADVLGYWMRYRPHFVVITQAKLTHASESGYATHEALLVNLWMAESATPPQGPLEPSRLAP